MNWSEQNALAQAAYRSVRFITASGHARANCPFCVTRVGKEDKKQALAFGTNTGWYKCWRCGTKGKLGGEEFKGEAPPGPAERPKVKHGAPEGFFPLAGDDSMVFEPARRYLATRGLGDQDVWGAAHIGASVKGRAAYRVIVPVLSPDGEWWGWVGRTWLNKKAVDRPYLNASGMTVGVEGHLYNHAALMVPTEEPVLVMEGVFDALAYWPDAVAVLGKPTDAQLLALQLAPRPVAFMLDGDSWREAESLAMLLRFKGQHAGSVRLPPGLDPDEVDRDEYRQKARECIQ